MNLGIEGFRGILIGKAEITVPFRAKG